MSIKNYKNINKKINYIGLNNNISFKIHKKGLKIS